jgi:hypothetical protein
VQDQTAVNRKAWDCALLTVRREQSCVDLEITRELDIDGPARVGSGLAAMGSAFVVAAGGLDADDGLGEELLAAGGAGVRSRGRAALSPTALPWTRKVPFKTDRIANPELWLVHETDQ